MLLLIDSPSLAYIVKTMISGGDFETIYRGAGNRHRQLHYRAKRHRAPDGQGVRGEQEYGTCGCNKGERFVTALYWVIE